MLRRLLVPILFCAFSAGCAHPQSREGCLERADEQYRRCENPYVVGNNVERVQPTTGEEGQQCRAAHQQAIERCNPPAPVPVPDLGRDAGTSTDGAAP